MIARTWIGLVLVIAAAGCAAPQGEDVDTDQGQAVSTGARTSPGTLPEDAPTTLDPELFGEWSVVRGEPALPSGYPAKVRVSLEREEEGPGYRITIVRADAPRVPAVDRPPFVRAGLPETCESVDMGRSSLRICHQTKIERQRLVHTVHTREWFGIVPGSSQLTTQTLTRDGDALRYTFRIRGEEEQSIELRR